MVETDEREGLDDLTVDTVDRCDVRNDALLEATEEATEEASDASSAIGLAVSEAASVQDSDDSPSVAV